MGSFQDFSKKLDRLTKNIKQLEGSQTVALTDIPTPAFVSRHTQFANAQELFDASGFKIESQEDFAAISKDGWDVFIRSVSAFPDWAAMMHAAIGERIKRQLQC